ncbi:MAG: FAD-dependent oxidoreductase [Candidatus Pacearchaeota archaeon]
MIYDLIIVGAGPAGINAAVYASRYRLKTLVIGEIVGGLVGEAYEICNFLTCFRLKGLELAKRMAEHAKQEGIEIINEKVIGVKKKNNFFEIKTENKKYETKKIIIATGTEKRKLGLKNEDKLLGKGISYCATCDAPLYKNKIVGVVGGSDAALTSALLLAEYAKKVFIIYRRDKFYRAEPAWVEIVSKNKKIKPLFNLEVKELIGKEKLMAVKLSNSKVLALDGLFIEIGGLPRKELALQLGVKIDNKGYIIVDRNQKTSVKGVFAAGDVTNNPLKQIITAASEGAVAAFSAYQEIQKEKSNI